MATPLPRRVLEYVRRHQLARPGDRVLVAVSGGADSVALLYALRSMGHVLPLHLTVAHLNHGIRGSAAARDARFVEKLAARLGLVYAGGFADVPALARKTGDSLEMAGRKARYAFLEKTALDSGCRSVATAHTADDNAETLLLMLLRGCGLQGLAGMAPESQYGKVRIIRPMLGLSRVEIERYLRASSLPWKEDSSNTDLDFVRNRVRRELLPLMEARYNPRIRETLARLAEVLREENSLLEMLSRRALARAARSRGRALDCKTLAACHAALRRRVLRQWLGANAASFQSTGFRLINDVDAMMLPGGARRMELTGGMLVERCANRLVIGRKQVEITSVYRRRICIPGRTLLPAAGLVVDARLAAGIQRERAPFGRYPTGASLSLARLGNRSLWARPWRPGDRMRPFGLDGSKKIHDIFADAKVPARLRAKLPVFTCGGEVVWIPGYRIAADWTVSGIREKALQLTVARLESG